MHAFRRVLVYTSHYVQIYLFRYEWNKWCKQTYEVIKNRVESHKRIDLIVKHTASPETAAAAPHIPVTQFVDKFMYCSGWLGYQILIQILINKRNQGIEP